MVALLAALTLAPWTHPLVFRSLSGWTTGASGTVHSAYIGHNKYLRGPVESAAWIAKNVRYRSPATEDPPNGTLTRLPRRGLIVWAVIYGPVARGEGMIRLDLRLAKHFPCCEGEYVAGGTDELWGAGPGRAYSVIVRVFFGSRATRAMKSDAQRAVRSLKLPRARR
jgi:hypothetical protein